MPKRDDPQYIEIENFEEYELTNCIAYEMVIRNDEFTKGKKELSALYNKFHNFSSLCYQNYQKEFNKIYKNNKFYTSREEEHNAYMEEFNKYMDSEFKDETEYCKEWKRLEKIWEKLLMQFEYNFGLIFFTESDFKNNKKRHQLNHGLLESYVHATNKKTGESFYLDKSSNVNEVVYGVKKITEIKGESFSNIVMARPRLKFPNMKQTFIELNMALSLKEKRAYLNKIQKIFDEQPEIIKTAFDIFEDELNISSNKKNILSNTEKIADMFFLYDYLKEDNTKGRKDDASSEISRYYQDIKKKENKFTDKTRGVFYGKAVEYIDKKRFKELIIGQSS